MQDAKDLAFLMHPNHRTDATEGSRTARGQAAGCIKKAPAEAGASRVCGMEGEREEKPADARSADGKARAGLMAKHGRGDAEWVPDLDGWLAEKAARRAAGGSHDSNARGQMPARYGGDAQEQRDLNCSPLPLGRDAKHEPSSSNCGFGHAKANHNAEQEMFHRSALCLGGLGGNQLRQLSTAVHVVEGDGQTSACAEVDHLAGHVGWKVLAALVVTDVSLGATDAVGHRLLCHAEAFSDGLEVMHALIVVALLCKVNSGTALPS